MITLFIFLNSMVIVKEVNLNQFNNLHIVRVMDNCDSITKKKLFMNVVKGLEYMNATDTLTDQEFIVLIKTYNTLHIGSLMVSEEESCVYIYYTKVFQKKFMSENAYTKFGWTIGKGYSSYYFSKYDLYIGIGETLRCKDIYLIQN